MSDYYILDGRTPVPCDDLLEWGKRFDIDNRVVAATSIGKSRVSTVFLGLDHGFGGQVLLFETMVFGGPLDGEMDRYATWDEAEQGHGAMVKRAAAASRPGIKLVRWIKRIFGKR